MLKYARRFALLAPIARSSASRAEFAVPPLFAKNVAS
jgi:hypothetical protein